MTPSPDVQVCQDCGYSEFSIPQSWLSAGWLRSSRPETINPGRAAFSAKVAVGAD
jgi:hypothetical protein